MPQLAVRTVGAFVLLCTIAWGQGLAVLPLSVSFPPVGVNEKALPQIITIYAEDDSGEEVYEFQGLTFSSPSSPFSVLKSSSNSVSPLHPVSLSLGFQLDRVADSISDVLTITYRHRGSVGSLSVNVRASVECRSIGDCDPVGPLCSVKANNEQFVQYRVPDYFGTVSPAIRDHAFAHSKHEDYTLPVTFLWRLVGLDKLLDKPALDCCSRDIYFTRIGNLDRLVNFKWTGRSFQLRSKNVPGAPSITIDVPSDMHGQSIVGGGYSEFHFADNTGPTITIADSSGGVFSGSLACFNATFGSATIRQVSPGPKPPKLNMKIIPQ